VGSEEAKTVFLTGGTGFVGGAALRELLARGYRVRCLARQKSVGKLPKAERVEVVAADLLAPRAYTRQLGGCVAAVHCVGIIAETRDETFRGIHIEGTQNLVVACQKMGVRRLVHISALGARPSPDIPYFHTKHEAEILVRTSGLDWTILRPSLVHGPDGKLIRMLARMVRGPLPVPVPGNGRQPLQPVFVGDLARIIADALERPATAGRTYEVGGDRVVTYDELLDALSQAILGRRRWKVHVPVFLAKLGAAMLEAVLSRPPFTRAQLRMLFAGSVCESLEPLERDFGFRPPGFEQSLAGYAEQLKPRRKT
jgi:NADH dehydrogenase